MGFVGMSDLGDRNVEFRREKRNLGDFGIIFCSFFGLFGSYLVF